MKKYVAITIILTVLTGALGVGAQVPVNSGKGQMLEFDSLLKNSPAGGNNVVLSDETDEQFGTVRQYAYDGGLTNTNLQFSLQFTNSETAATGSYYYISFYYRFLQTDGYELPNSFVRRPYVNNNSGQQSLGAPSGEWKKVSFITTSTASISSTALIQMRLIPFITAGTKICIQIAEPTCVYFGVVTADGDLSPEQVIEEMLGKSDIETVSIGGKNIEVSEFPNEYYADIEWDGESMPIVTAETFAEGNYEVSCDSDRLPAKYTVTSKSLNYDKLTGKGGTTEYTVYADYVKATAEIDVNDATVSDNYKVSNSDTININYRICNFSGEEKNRTIILVFRDGKAFKDIITWRVKCENGITDNICSFDVANERLSGCTVAAYVLDNENMTVLN